MKRMGINQEEIKAREVIIRTEDSEIVFNNPLVTKIDMMGEATYQIVGKGVKRPISPEEKKIEISEEDIKLVIEQTGTSRENAIETLNKTEGDIAKAILLIKGEE